MLTLHSELKQYGVWLRIGLRGSIPGKGRRFFLQPLRPDRLWVPPSPHLNGYRGPFPWGNTRLPRWRSSWSYISSPLRVSMACNGTASRCFPSHICLCPPSGLPPSSLQSKTVYAFFVSLCCTQIFLLPLVTLLIFGYRYKSWNCSLCRPNCFLLPVT
jgi:hypothetical protein